jgi:Phage P22-like portal protein
MTETEGGWGRAWADTEPTVAWEVALIKEAKDRFQRCEEWESIARIRFEYDYKFANGDMHNKYQWDSELVYNRELQDRPCITINKTAQHNLLIVNDAKQNKPGVRIRPVGDDATFEGAQIFQEVIYHIEYISNAEQVYDYATTFQVEAGIGYWRVLVDYIDDNSFDQEIYIRRVKDPRSVYLDPDINEADGSDARYGFVFDDIPKDLFEAEYPKYADIVGKAALGNTTTDMWITQNHVRIAEYYKKEEKKDRLVSFLHPDTQQPVQGKLSELDENTQAVFREIKAREKQLSPELRTYRERKVLSNQIMWYKIAGNRVVEKSPWLGKYIPIVRLPGTETIIDGQLDRKGHTRALINAQQIYNWNTSANQEFGALQTKSPWLASIEAIEGFEEYYKTANTKNHSFMPFRAFDDDGNQLPPPTRPQPPMPSPAYVQQMQISQNEMMMVSGQYQSQMGENENAKSGVAINARQRQGDRATYHFIDNQAIAIRFTGKILLDLIPKVYDTERVKRIEARDGRILNVTIDPDSEIGLQNITNVNQLELDKNRQVEEIIWNPNVGYYDVQADTGPSFATRRQEAFNALTQIAAQNPEFMHIAGDILWKVADFPEAQVLADRWRKIIPPNVTGDAPPPEMQQQAEMIQQQLAVIAKQAKELADKDKDLTIKAKQLDLDHKKAIAEQHRLDYDAETKRLTALGNFGPGDTPPPFDKKKIKAVGDGLLEGMVRAGEPDVNNEGTDSVPGVAGSRQAPDGRHYVKRGNQHYRVDVNFHPRHIGARQAPDGHHYVQDNAGQYHRVLHG